MGRIRRLFRGRLVKRTKRLSKQEILVVYVSPPGKQHNREIVPFQVYEQERRTFVDGAEQPTTS